jgi:YebC/PmpR family DNA-binding regulatory protein
MFTKVIKEITIAARLGGGDEESNPRLRTAILKAKAVNMPKDNIERAIKKGTGDLEGTSYTEITYEGYGPGGVAILVDSMTDNKNRTAADIRNIFSKGGGNLGESGSVSYLFKRKGLISFDTEQYSEDKIFEPALEAGAEDVSTEAGTIEVVTEPNAFEEVLKTLNAAGFEHSMAEITMIPETTVSLDKVHTTKALRLIERLDEHDDVQSVSTNLDVPDDFELEDE